MIDKRKLKLLFPNWTNKQIEDSDTCGKPTFGASMYPQLEQINNLFPVSDVTGHADTFITKFFTSLTAEERELISKFVSEVPALPNFKLSDDDLMRLTPSRYYQDATELEMYREAMSSIVKSEYNRLHPEPTSEPTSEPTLEPTSEPVS